MKRFAFIIALTLMLILFFTQCKKTDTTTIPAVVASWVWLYTYKNLPLSPTNPLTPANTSLVEVLTFKNDRTWNKVQNGIIVDSGTFKLGHGTFPTYPVATIFVYDSIKYYKRGLPYAVDYYRMKEDTMIFDPGERGIYGAGTKWFVKQ
jgi:hypothetical protein